MRRLLTAIAVLLLPALAQAATAESAQPPLKSGSGHFVFEDTEANLGKEITVWYHRPKTKPLAELPVVFVMHGLLRNGEEYRDDWVAHAEREEFLLIVPEFTDEQFPGSWRYTLGNVFSATGKRKPEKVWAFTLLESLFDTMKARYGVTASRYDLYGHGAGAQFVHRFILFKNPNRVRTAIAANAGWYTMPDQSVDLPYGITNATLPTDDLRSALSVNLIILLGTADNDPQHRRLNNSAKARAQGHHRLERGENFVAAGKRVAERLKTRFRWQVRYVEGLAHSNNCMAKSASRLVGRPH